MLLPNQQKKALFRLSVESAGGAKEKGGFSRLFCMKKSQRCKLSRQHVCNCNNSLLVWQYRNVCAKILS